MNIKAFQAVLRKQKIDQAVFVGEDPAIAYFAKNSLSYAVLHITPRAATLYLSALDVAPDTLVTRPLSAWKPQRAGLRVGLNYAAMTLAQRRSIKKSYPQAKFADISDELTLLRNIKTSKEIALLQKACNLTTQAFKALLPVLPTLKTEIDVALFLEQTIRRAGGGIAFPTIVAMGKNAAVPHHQTSRARLHRGFLLLDFGASWQGYCADMTRMVFLGTPRDKEQENYDLLLRAQQASIEALQVGKTYGEIAVHCRSILGDASKYFTHALGHGLGREVHESIGVHQSSKDSITSGHVFTIEPGLYYPGKYGLRIEDSIYFDGQPKILTKASKVLPCIPY